jgi:hypothetical protein
MTQTPIASSLLCEAAAYGFATACIGGFVITTEAALSRLAY